MKQASLLLDTICDECLKRCLKVKDENIDSAIVWWCIWPVSSLPKWTSTRARTSCIRGEENNRAGHRGRGVVQPCTRSLTHALPESSAVTDRAVCSNAGFGPSTERPSAPLAAGTEWREEGRVGGGVAGAAGRSSSPLQCCNIARKKKGEGFLAMRKDKMTENLRMNTHLKSSRLGLLRTLDGDSGGSGMMAPSSGIPGNKNLQHHFLT